MTAILTIALVVLTASFIVILDTALVGLKRSVELLRQDIESITRKLDQLKDGRPTKDSEQPKQTNKPKHNWRRKPESKTCSRCGQPGQITMADVKEKGTLVYHLACLRCKRKWQFTEQTGSPQ